MKKKRKKIDETENHICSLFIRGPPSGGYLYGVPGTRERSRQRERERERESNPEEKSAADTDVYVDVEKHSQEGVRVQEAAGTDDDTSRHTKE